MKTRTLSAAAGVLLLAGSAALFAMSVDGGVSEDGTDQSGRSTRFVEPPAFSVVVTSRRSTPGQSFLRKSGRSGALKSASATDHGWGEAPGDHRS